MAKCEECGLEGADEVVATVYDPDAHRDGGRPIYVVRYFLCEEHAGELHDDDLVLEWRYA